MKINRMRITVDGLNRARLLKTLTFEGITLENIYNVPSEKLKFTIKSADKAKTFAILKKLCYNYAVERDNGPAAVFRRLAERLGVLTGFLLAAVFCALISRSVFFVRVIKVENVDEKEVIRAVKSAADIPSFKDNIPLDKIRHEVSSLDGVALCNVGIRGNYIVVEVIGASEKPIKPEKTDIRSSCDAIITRIVAKKGNAVKNVGDVVKKGDLLISGEIMSSDGSEVIQTVLPEGEVWGNVVLRAGVLLPEVVTVKKRTGKTSTYSFLTFGGYEPRSEKPYKNCDIITESVFTGIFLPLKFTKITYCETQFVQEKTDAEKEAEKIIDYLAASAVGTLIGTKITTTEKGGGITELNVYLTYERKISV